MRYGELVRKLRRLGVEFYRQGRGSHEIWWRPEDGRKATIPNHPGKEIPNRTLRQMLRDLGLSRGDLDNV